MGWVLTPRPAFLPPGMTRYPWYMKLGEPQRRSGGLRKISPSLGFDPLTVQSVARRYTYYAIPVHIFRRNLSELYIFNSLVTLFIVEWVFFSAADFKNFFSAVPVLLSRYYSKVRCFFVII